MILSLKALEPGAPDVQGEVKMDDSDQEEIVNLPLLCLFFLKIYFYLWETDHVGGRGQGRGGERISSRLSAESGAQWGA